MATKSASYRYGNSDNKPTRHINYAWAKAFNKNTLIKHYKEHGLELGLQNEDEYAAKAIRFANNVDRIHYTSYIDKKGSTHKFSKETNEYAIIDKKGYVITYFKLDGGYKRYKQLIKRGK